MPRPKRSKIAPSVPAPHPRKVLRAAPAADSQTEPEQNDPYDISDPEEGVVVSARRVKRNSGKGRALQIEREVHVEQAVAGAMESEDTLTNADGRIPGIPTETSLLADINLDSSSLSVEIGRRDRSAGTIENSLLAMGNFKRRPRQSSILGRGPARARSSSVESNLANGNGLMSVGRKNNSTMGNGHRIDPNVNGQPRGRIRSSSVGLEMAGTPAIGSALRLGNFKRRAREPSILGTVRKKQQERVPYDDDEDDFNPDDESTPLNLSKTRTMNSSSAPSSSNSRKRKISAVQVPQSQTRSSASLPRDEFVQEPEVVPVSGRILNDGSDARDDVNAKNPGEEYDGGEEENYEVAPSSPLQQLPVASIEDRSVTPEPWSETMAPPQSSSLSPLRSPTQPRVQIAQSTRPPSRGRRPLRGQTPMIYSQVSPPSSPPSLIHSPNRSARAPAKSKVQKQPPPPSKLSTAQLQALLPRRRQHGRSEFDIASSDDEIDVTGLAPDDDELTHSTIRAPPRRGFALSRTKEKSVSKPKSASKRTYGSKRATSDKENDEEHGPDDSLAPLADDESENSQELEKRVGKELKLAAKKFAEVDKWEMEFEDVAASSSSPKNAR
ncbi:hypothetical protein BJ878DRAFT_241828 [Calycina marina]|uniref:Uncharacterized protein n=1 Tax=Calycina marina TaxID=1763456 RepID=A0A9P7Z7Y6_9HELO|nr:hypothetical protein BJ878DRAFT_241828 [Calycina marina]